MEAKEKAKELVETFYKLQENIDWGNENAKKEAGIIYENNKVDYEEFYRKLAKESALICVDETLKTIGSDIFFEYKYWQEVKFEIEKL